MSRKAQGTTSNKGNQSSLAGVIDWKSPRLPFMKYGKHSLYIKRAGGRVAISDTENFENHVECSIDDMNSMVIGEASSALNSMQRRTRGHQQR